MQRVGSGFGDGLKGSTWKSVIDSGVKQVNFREGEDIGNASPKSFMFIFKFVTGICR